MHLSPVFFTFFLVISVGRCQFVYNYEEADTDSSEESVDPALYQYNSPSATNEQFQSRRVQSRTVPQEAQNTGSRRNRVRENTPVPETQTQPSSEYIEESETPRNDATQGPRKRKYRRILREGTYVAPPQTPRVYSPSIFENIGLGQAPSGVFVPQDSFLSVLKTPSFRQSTPSQYIPQNNPTYYQPSFAQGPTFYVEPSSNGEGRQQPRADLPAVQPSVRYVDSSAMSMSTENPIASMEMPNRRRSPAARQRQQRQQNPSNNVVEPTVDIDALRIRPDAIREHTPYIPQARRVNQPIVSLNRQRSTAALQTYQPPIQTSRSYSPSIFQNVGLGEAPNGVHIPPDSLLNVLRSSPSRSQSPSRNTFENPQVSNNVNSEEQNDFQPETSVQPESPPPDSRRRSRQRSRTSNTSSRSMQRQTQYQAEDEESQRIPTASVSSQQPRRQQNQMRNSGANRRRDSNAAERKPIAPQQEMSERSKPSQSSSSRRQQNYKPAKLAIAALPEDTDEDGIPGEAGVNYPTLHTIPRTTFACAEQQHNGYYADLETSCQVVHLCQARGVKSSFLCPNGTIFSQEKFSCQWWYKVNCEDSPKFYSINDSLYKIPEKKKSSRE